MAANRTAYLLDLPLVPYRRARELQLAMVESRYSGRLAHDAVIMLEHAPVFTMGRRGGTDNLLISRSELEARSIEVVPIERGGDITYHGPGQLVVYVLMDIRSRRIGVTEFVTCLEKAMARTAARWNVAAAGDPDNRGAWVDRRKLGSIGITVRRGVTFHGLAMNVSTDLEPFEWVNPCGLVGCRMTTLEQEAGRRIRMSAVRREMAAHLSELFDMELVRVDLDTLKPQL